MVFWPNQFLWKFETTPKAMKVQVENEQQYFFKDSNYQSKPDFLCLPGFILFCLMCMWNISKKNCFSKNFFRKMISWAF